MAGVKGKSGRKSWDKEQDCRKLWCLAVPLLEIMLQGNPKRKGKQRINRQQAAFALSVFNKLAPAHPVSPVTPNETRVIIIRDSPQANGRTNGKTRNHPQAVSEAVSLL